LKASSRPLWLTVACAFGALSNWFRGANNTPQASNA
jgi:hypothetical protein